MPKPYDDAMKKLVGGKRRFAMLEDILRDTPVYQEVLARGVEEGLEKGKELGLEKGLEKGKELGLEKGLEAQRQTLLDIVEERFPAITHVARRQAEAIKDPDVLRRLTVKISIVRTSQEAEQYLLHPSSLENRH